LKEDNKKKKKFKMKLSELKIGESAYIVEIRGEASFARRLSELGFVRGQKNS
jgi:ferrous iron transport protein B